MTAHNSAHIQLNDQPYVFTVEDKQTLLSVVDQLNAVTTRLHQLEEQIDNGTLIINPRSTGHLQSAPDLVPPTRNGAQTGWQPTR